MNNKTHLENKIKHIGSELNFLSVRKQDLHSRIADLKKEYERTQDKIDILNAEILNVMSEFITYEK